MKKIKVIVFADIHGATHNLLKLVPLIESADAALFLGDGVSTMEVLPNYLNRKIVAVRGNGDLFCKLPDELLVEIENTRIFMAHGHSYGVKGGHDRIVSAAREQGAQICLFAHTHRFEHAVDKGMTVINIPPIGTSRTTQGGSFIILTLGDKDIGVELKKV